MANLLALCQMWYQELPKHEEEREQSRQNGKPYELRTFMSTSHRYQTNNPSG
jgi:hypothetical protein